MPSVDDKQYKRHQRRRRGVLVEPRYLHSPCASLSRRTRYPLKGYAETRKFLRHNESADTGYWAAFFICPKRVWKIKSSFSQRVCEKAKVEQLLHSSFYVANLLARARGSSEDSSYPSSLCNTLSPFLAAPHASLFVALFVYHKQ